MRTKNPKGEEYKTGIAELKLAKINGNDKNNGLKFISKKSSYDDPGRKANTYSAN